MGQQFTQLSISSVNTTSTSATTLYTSSALTINGGFISSYINATNNGYGAYANFTLTLNSISGTQIGGASSVDSYIYGYYNNTGTTLTNTTILLNGWASGGFFGAGTANFSGFINIVT